MKKYFLCYWGQIENDNWVERDLGIKEKNFWFESKKEREKFKQKLKDVANNHNVIIAFREEEGGLVNKKTIAENVLEFQGKEYVFNYNFGYGYPKESAEYMFTEGNYSCDCNLSLFIQEFCDDTFPKLECGNKIKLIDLNIKHE